MISYVLSPLFFGEASFFQKKKKIIIITIKRNTSITVFPPRKFEFLSLFFFQSAYTLFQFLNKVHAHTNITLFHSLSFYFFFENKGHTHTQRSLGRYHCITFLFFLWSSALLSVLVLIFLLLSFLFFCQVLFLEVVLPHCCLIPEYLTSTRATSLVKGSSTHHGFSRRPRHSHEACVWYSVLRNATFLR